MKRFFVFLILIGVVMFVEINAVEIAYLQTPDGIAYSVNDDGEIVIEGTAGYVNKVVIPDEIDGFPVRYIAEWAFYNNPNITQVTISNNVIDIGKEAFGNCQELKTVVLPDGLETIEMGMFIKCVMLKNIVLPDTLKTINEFAFEGCMRLKNLIIPASVELIGHEAFIGCESLLMDVSQNQYAAEYAKANSIETDYESSWDYVFLQTVIITAISGLVCLIAYIIFEFVRKRKTPR